MRYEIIGVHSNGRVGRVRTNTTEEARTLMAEWQTGYSARYIAIFTVFTEERISMLEEWYKGDRVR